MGSSQWHGNVVPAFLGGFLAIWYKVQWFSSEMELQITFWTNYCKKHYLDKIALFYLWYTDEWINIQKHGREWLKLFTCNPPGFKAKYRVCDFHVVCHFTVTNPTMEPFFVFFCHLRFYGVRVNPKLSSDMHVCKYWIGKAASGNPDLVQWEVQYLEPE